MKFHFTVILFCLLSRGELGFRAPLPCSGDLTRGPRLLPLPAPHTVWAGTGLWGAGGRGSRRRREGALGSPLCPQILERLNKMCGVGEQMRKKQQRLLKNMDAHKVMLDLLQIPYDKVTLTADR